MCSPSADGGLDIGTLPEVATVEELADLLRLSTSAVYEAVRRGELPALRIGRRIRFPREVVVAILRRPFGQPARGRHSGRT